MAHPPQIDPILDRLGDYREQLRQVREIVLANAVMFGEIPAPTFGEERRIRFLCDRYTESGLQNISTDELQNGTAILPGSEGKRNILVSAHVDTPFLESVDHTVSVESGTIRGPGIADNSLGLAVIASLPAMLEKLGIELKSNIIFLGSTRSLGKGDLQGLRFFLENVKVPIHAAICVEGSQSGRLSYSCLGMLRGEITVTVPDELNWNSFGHRGAISGINRIITNILAIPTPEEPQTSIILGSVNAGTGFNRPPMSATLRFEVRSEQVGMIGQIYNHISSIVEEVDAEGHLNATLDIMSRRKPGGIPFSHPLVQTTRAVMDRLGIEPQIAPSVGDLSAVVDNQIPGVTIGITKGRKRQQMDESIEIEPMFGGLAELIGVLTAIDEGVCDEQD